MANLQYVNFLSAEPGSCLPDDAARGQEDEKFQQPPTQQTDVHRLNRKWENLLGPEAGSDLGNRPSKICLCYRSKN